MGLADLPDHDPRPLKQKWELRPSKLERADVRKKRESLDDKESDKVKVRSKGQCEVVELHPESKYRAMAVRCKRRAVHVHHMLSGNGVRARGKSALAEHKQHLCDQCHSDIHGKVLRRFGQVEPMWTDEYERVK
jgi:hypothetical protein